MTHRQLICPVIYTDQLFQISNIFNIPVELLDGCRDPREVLKVISFTEFYLINKLISRMWAGFLNSQNTAGPSKKWKFDRICKNRKPDFLETTFISHLRSQYFSSKIRIHVLYLYITEIMERNPNKFKSLKKKQCRNILIALTLEKSNMLTLYMKENPTHLYK